MKRRGVEGMPVSCELKSFIQQSHKIGKTLEKVSGVERLALSFMHLSTKLLQQGDFDGACESFFNAKAMFQMSQGDPQYARDFYDYLVDCSALLIDGNKDNFKDNKNYEAGIESYNFNNKKVPESRSDGDWMSTPHVDEIYYNNGNHDNCKDNNYMYKRNLFHAVNAIDLSRPNESKGSVLGISTRFEAMEIDLYNSLLKFSLLYVEEDSSTYPYYSPRDENSGTSRNIVSQSNSKSLEIVSLEHHIPLETLELVSPTNHTLEEGILIESNEVTNCSITIESESNYSHENLNTNMDNLIVTKEVYHSNQQNNGTCHEEPYSKVEEIRSDVILVHGNAKIQGTITKGINHEVSSLFQVKVHAKQRRWHPRMQRH